MSWNQCQTCKIFESQSVLLFLGSVYLCVICYEHRHDKKWNKKSAWALRYQQRKTANLSIEQKKALKEWNEDCAAWKARIAMEIRNATPLPKSYWAHTFDYSSGRSGNYIPTHLRVKK
jgi:hypothetical protein